MYWVLMDTVNPLSSPFEEGLKETEGLFEKRGGGGLFNFGKTMVSVLHK